MWYHIWYHVAQGSRCMISEVYDIKRIIWYWCLWYYITMISYAYDIIPDYVWYQRTYDIIDLWYHRQYHRSWTMILCMISSSRIYDVTTLYVWYQRTYDIIGLWYHRQYHRFWTMISCMISSSWIYDIIILNLWYQRTYDIIDLWYHR